MRHQREETTKNKTNLRFVVENFDLLSKTDLEKKKKETGGRKKLKEK